MKLLLDTHILLWVMQDAPQLGLAARRLLNEAETIHVSSVSLWEIAIKSALGKLKVDQGELDNQLDKIGFAPLPVTWAHTRGLRKLPPLHANPFDRMLVAQASIEPLHLLTHDAALQPYSNLVIVV